MSTSIKVTLPEEFNPDERAYFYQKLSILNYFLLPGTNVFLKVENKDNNGDKHYKLEINFNKTVVKTSLESNDYHNAIKKMMISLQDKFTDILDSVNNREKKEKTNDSCESKKTYH